MNILNKNNNQNNNYINQLSRLPLLKHTHRHIHTHTHTHKALAASLTKEKALLRQLGQRSLWQESGNRNRQQLPQGPPSQMLQGSQIYLVFMQVQLTKSQLTSVSLLKHFPISYWFHFFLSCIIPTQFLFGILSAFSIFQQMTCIRVTCCSCIVNAYFKNKQ